MTYDAGRDMSGCRELTFSRTSHRAWRETPTLEASARLEVRAAQNDCEDALKRQGG